MVSGKRKGKMMRRVEEEEGQPFWDVVREYAAMGYSKSETANILGYRGATGLFSLIKRYPEEKINWCNPAQSSLAKDYYERCRRPDSPEYEVVLKAARKAARNRASRYVIDGISDTLRGHHERLQPDVSLDTVVARVSRYKWTAEQALKLPKTSRQDSGLRGIQKRWKNERASRRE